jgi:4-hydroxy-tetrahydrodipicolinate synthase
MNVIDLIFEENNPAGVKALMAKLSLCHNTVRLPLVEASVKLQEKINTFIQEYQS